MTDLSESSRSDLEARRCGRCRERKPLDQFVRNKSDRSGRGYYCKPCHNEISRRNRENKHGSVRNYMLKHRYGITEEKLSDLMAAQSGLCAICGQRKALHVDHDHKTGAVRGVLCFRCNNALGQFLDDARWLLRAVEYLETHRNGVCEESEPYDGVERVKRCSDCGELKVESEFPRNRNSSDGRHCYCKPCHNSRGRETKARLYGGSRHYRLRQKYGIGAAEVEKFILEQGGLCAICRIRPAEQVDHDHGTGAVRAILCGGCNAGIGLFGEEPNVIRRAVVYLEQSQAHGEDGVHEPAAPYILSVA